MKNRKDKKILALIIALCLITAGSVVVTVYLLMNQPKPSESTPSNIYYPPISRDPGAEPIGDEDTSQPPLENPPGGGAVSLTFSKEAIAPKGDGAARIMFRNPSKSNQSIVIQLQITDKVLIEKLGKTGRTAAQKAQIEGAEDYDSEKSRMIIAESGLLEPGYKLGELKLKPLPDGTVLPKGVYDAVYYILAYDRETNERAVVNMQIPIKLTIEG